MSKYKHAMEIIENWTTKTEELYQYGWNSPASATPGHIPLDRLNDPSRYRIKREPRRVWVNIDKTGNPGNSWSSPEEAKRRTHDSWCSESAVEFVEVVK